MSLVAGSAAQPGQARNHPLLPHVSVSLLHYTSFQAAVNHNDLCRRQRARESERENEREREGEKESLSCLYLCAFAYINASIYLSAVATKLISGGFFLPYNRWGNPSSPGSHTSSPSLAIFAAPLLTRSFIFHLNFI